MARQRSTMRFETRHGFGRYRRQLQAAARDGVIAASEAAAANARVLAPVGDGKSGITPGHLRDTIEPVNVGRSRRGYSGGVGSSDPVAVFLELGTFGRRTRKARQAGTEIRRKFNRSAKTGAGIPPRRFLRKAAINALPTLLATMKARAGRRIL